MGLTFWRQSLAWQIAGWLALVVTLTATAAIAALSWHTQQLLEREAMHSLEGITSSTVDLVETWHHELDDQMLHLAQLFAGMYGSRFSLAPPADASSTPVLLNEGQAVNGNFEAVDRFARATGGTATVFVRRGQDFVRVATSVKNEAGERAVGTTLARDSAAWKSLQQSQAWFGRTQLFGRDFITRYQPLQDESGQIIGALYVGLDMTRSISGLRERVGKIKVGKTGYVYVLDAASGKDYGRLIVHPAKQGQVIADAADADGRQFIREILQRRAGVIRYPWINTELNERTAREKVVVYAPAPSFNWVVAAGSYTEEFYSVSNAVQRGMLLTLAVTVGASLILIVVLLRRKVARPLGQLVDQLQRLAAGDYRQTLTARGDDEIARLLQAAATMQERVRHALIEVAGSAGQVHQATTVLAQSAAQVSEGSRTQAEAASTVAAAVEQMTVSMQQVADHASEARTISQDAGERGRSGVGIIEQTAAAIGDIADSVRAANARMQEVQQQSNDISGVVQVIREIADQTNLLALNAAIEAARAGEQGRGFAVVADEVRKLAERTAQSTGTIVSTINAMQQSAGSAMHGLSNSVQQVERGVTLASQAGDAIADIRGGLEQVLQAVHDISLAIQEQSSASNLVAGQVERIARMTEHNSAAVQATRGQAESLQDLAQHLQVTVTHFKT